MSIFRSVILKWKKVVSLKSEIFQINWDTFRSTIWCISLTVTQKSRVLAAKYGTLLPIMQTSREFLARAATIITISIQSIDVRQLLDRLVTIKVDALKAYRNYWPRNAIDTIYRKNAQVIPRMAFTSFYSELLDYTTPIWQTRYVVS